MRNKIAIIFSVLFICSSLVNATSIDTNSSANGNLSNLSSISDSSFESLNSSVGILTSPLMGIEHLMNNSVQTSGVLNGSVNSLLNFVSNILDLFGYFL